MHPEQCQYDGCVLYPSLGADPVTGKIAVGLYHLTFTSDGGVVTLPLDNLRIAEIEDRRIAFSTESVPDCVITTSDDRILKDYFILRRNNLRTQAREIRQLRESRRMLKLAGVFLGSCCIIAFVGWLLSSFVVSFLVAQVPVELERDLGEIAYAELRKKIPVRADPALEARVQPVLARLAAALPDKRYEFEVEFVDLPLPNAFALPGGRILVCDGLFEMAKTPEELAGVLAHEMAHVTRRHGLRTLVSTKGPYHMLRLFVRDKRGFIAGVLAGSELLVTLQHSRRLETEADEVGWRLLEAANIDPRGLASFLRRLQVEEARINARLARIFGSSSVPRPPKIFSTHPDTQERIERLDKLWERAKRKSGFEKFDTNALLNPGCGN